MQTTNKNIIVSGGSRGLGLFICDFLLKNGNSVGSFARSKTEHVEKLEAEYPDRYVFIAADGRDYPTLNTFINDFTKRFGDIHGLVNNAAIGQDHLLVGASSETISSIISINIEAPIRLTKMVLKKMLLQGGGGEIVNISSICGSKGYTGLTVYSASKGALDAFSRSLAREVGARKIHVNNICPGFFESDMSSVLLPEQLDAIKRRTPNGILTEPENVVHILDTLLSGQSNINGQSIFIDGGASI